MGVGQEHNPLAVRRVHLAFSLVAAAIHVRSPWVVCQYCQYWNNDKYILSSSCIINICSLFKGSELINHRPSYQLQRLYLMHTVDECCAVYDLTAEQNKKAVKGIPLLATVTTIII